MSKRLPGCEDPAADRLEQLGQAWLDARDAAKAAAESRDEKEVALIEAMHSAGVVATRCGGKLITITLRAKIKVARGVGGDE